MNMIGKLQKAYSDFLTSEDCKNSDITLEQFKSLLIADDQIAKKFGRRITKKLDLGERMMIAYPDEKERRETILFLGSEYAKKHLDRLGIPKRKLFLFRMDIKKGIIWYE